MQQNERTYIYNSRYRVVDEEVFLAETSETPFAEVHTNISEKTFLSSYSALRRKYVLPVILLPVTGVLMIAAAMLGADKWQDENTAYFITLLAAIPIGTALTLALKSYLKSAAFLSNLGAKAEKKWDKSCDIAFYSDCLTCHDRLNNWAFTKKGIEVIPYTAIRKMLRTDDVFVLMDGHDKGIYMMRKDIPSGIEEKIAAKCTKAALTERTAL